MIRPFLGRRATTRLSLAALCSLCLVPSVAARGSWAALAAPVVSIPNSALRGSDEPRLRVVRNVRLDLAEDAPRVSLVLRNGRIAAVLEGAAEVPAGALEVDGKGALAVPAFLDAFSTAGLAMTEPTPEQDRPVPTESDVRVDMRVANRKGIQPAFRAAEAVALAEADAAALRKAGFGATLAAPTGELLSGSSALLVTRDAAIRELLLAPDVFQHATFSAHGDGYPSTLMGYQSQLRQFFLDARWQETRLRRYADGAADPRPPVDVDLAAVLPVLDGERRLICETDNARDIERWLGLAEEAGFQLAIAGGRQAWKVADLLREREVPVFLTLDWGDEVEDPAAKDDTEVEPEDDGGEDEPEPAAAAEPAADEAEDAAEEGPDWIYTEPLGVRTERRRLWEEGRDCALRLHEAGVVFAFGSGGGSASDLLGHVRELVEAGLPRDVAFEALTAGAARLLGVEAHLGTLEVGKDASFGLWTADPLSDGAKLAWLFVDGRAHEFDLDTPDREPPDDGLDATGTWDFEMTDEDGKQAARVVLEMSEDGDITGTLTRDNPLGEGEVQVTLEGFLSKHRLFLEGTLEVSDMQIELEIDGDLTADGFDGETTVRGPWGEDRRPTQATRAPDAEALRLEGQDEHAHPHQEEVR